MTDDRMLKANVPVVQGTTIHPRTFTRAVEAAAALYSAECNLIPLHLPNCCEEDQLVEHCGQSEHKKDCPNRGCTAAPATEDVLPKELVHVSVVTPPELSRGSGDKRPIHEITSGPAAKAPECGGCGERISNRQHECDHLACVFDEKRNV